ncbi:Esterase FE4 [Gryllus bimaculatus]|nr:Esterase FE4 [Gryllus bimaculatus]
MRGVPRWAREGCLDRSLVALQIRVFTDTRQPIMAFLGVPYAAPPVGELRFAAPERHAGWNGSLFAGSWRAACPQPQAAASAAGPALTDEDCLTLNVWAPDSPHYRPLPVVVFFEGQDFVTGAPQRFPGHDLAAEGLVVVAASYRLNVFGFLALGDAVARGNLGLLDQYVVLLWVRENIALFRGDPNAVTLMGHGAGAASAAMHLTSPRTAGLFQRAVLMSGSCASPWTRARPIAQVAAASRGLARKLGCLAPAPAPAPEDSALLLACLRAKPAAELLRAFEAQYQNSNWSELVGPVVDDFLPEDGVYLGRDPLEVLAADGSPVPVLTGVTSAEGTATLDQWSELARQGGAALRQFLEQTALPHALRRYGLLPEAGGGGPLGAGAGAAGDAAVRALASWRYAEVAGAAEGDTAALRSALLQLFADTRVLAPHRRQLRLLAGGPQPVFAYAFTQPSAPDPFAPAGPQPPLNLSGGAPHGSELLYLLGPTALVQAVGRRPTPGEERLAKSLKRLWAEFAHRGHIFDILYLKMFTQIVTIHLNIYCSEICMTVNY